MDVDIKAMRRNARWKMAAKGTWIIIYHMHRLSNSSHWQSCQSFSPGLGEANESQDSVVVATVNLVVVGGHDDGL